MSAMAVRNFLDEVVEHALNIFEQKLKATKLDRDRVRINATAESTCHSFLQEINSNAANMLGEKLAALESFRHQLGGPQKYRDVEMMHQTDLSEAQSQADTTEDPLEMGVIFSRRHPGDGNCDKLIEPPHGYGKPLYETSADVYGQGQLEKSEINMEDGIQDTQQPLVVGTRIQTDEFDGPNMDMMEDCVQPLAIQSGWPLLENDYDKVQEPPNKCAKPLCETFESVYGQRNSEFNERGEKQDNQQLSIERSGIQIEENKGPVEMGMTGYSPEPLAIQSGWPLLENDCDKLQEPPYKCAKPLYETLENVCGERNGEANVRREKKDNQQLPIEVTRIQTKEHEGQNEMDMTGYSSEPLAIQSGWPLLETDRDKLQEPLYECAEPLEDPSSVNITGQIERKVNVKGEGQDNQELSVKVTGIHREEHEGPVEIAMKGYSSGSLAIQSGWPLLENDCDKLQEPSYEGAKSLCETSSANACGQRNSEVIVGEEKQGSLEMGTTGYSSEPLAIRSGWPLVENNCEKLQEPPYECAKPLHGTFENTCGQRNGKAIVGEEKQDNPNLSVESTGIQIEEHKGPIEVDVTGYSCGPLAIQNEWPLLENDRDQLEEAPYECAKLQPIMPFSKTFRSGPLLLETNYETYSNSSELAKIDFAIQNMQEGDSPLPSAEQTVGEVDIMLTNISIEGCQRGSQNCDSKNQPQSKKSTQEQHKKMPKSPNVFFRLAKEWLQFGNREDNGFALSQPASASKEGVPVRQSSESTESFSCPCRFDWGIHEADVEEQELKENPSARNDQLDIDVLELNDRDELAEDEDQEVPGRPELDDVLDPEETVEISLYEDNKKVHSPPLDLGNDVAGVDDTLGQDAGDVDGTPGRQRCRLSPADDSCSPSASSTDAAITTGDMLPCHQWFQTDGRISAETMKRATPIPTCNRRRRVGLSRAQRVPSLHPKRLRMSEE